ncbi:hypothetical protein SVIOM342S_05154 [Streptomyces violaceorubidus]
MSNGIEPYGGCDVSGGTGTAVCPGVRSGYGVAEAGRAAGTSAGRRNGHVQSTAMADRRRGGLRRRPLQGRDERRGRARSCSGLARPARRSSPRMSSEREDEGTCAPGGGPDGAFVDGRVGGTWCCHGARWSFAMPLVDDLVRSSGQIAVYRHVTVGGPLAACQCQDPVVRRLWQLRRLQLRQQLLARGARRASRSSSGRRELVRVLVLAAPVGAATDVRLVEVGRRPWTSPELVDQGLRVRWTEGQVSSGSSRSRDRCGRRPPALPGPPAPLLPR